MKSRFLILFCFVIFYACSQRKLRDVRKLNWYEIVTEAQGKTIRVIIPTNEFEKWKLSFAEVEKELKEHVNIQIQLEPISNELLLDSLRKTNASLILIRGKQLEQALRENFLMGPFDRLLPIAKKIDTDADVFRKSEGVSSQGFAVPIENNLLVSLPKAFFAIPNNATSQAAALLILESMLEKEMELDSMSIQ